MFRHMYIFSPALANVFAHETLIGVLSRYGNIPYSLYTLLLLIIGSEYSLPIIYI